MIDCISPMRMGTQKSNACKISGVAYWLILFVLPSLQTPGGYPSPQQIHTHRLSWDGESASGEGFCLPRMPKPVRVCSRSSQGTRPR